MRDCLNCLYLNRDIERGCDKLCLCINSKCFALVRGKKDICEYYEPLPYEQERDLTFGLDARGDYAFFIEAHRINGWEIDQEAKDTLSTEATFFRVLQNNAPTSSHGWIENKKIVQWG